jgi:hypothetical protein
VLRHPRHQVTVVFDGGSYGYPATRDPHRVRTIFARSPGDADTRLIHMLEACSHPAGHTLVSADRAIKAAATARSIAVMPPVQFIGLLNAPPPRRNNRRHVAQPEPRRPRQEVDEWLRIFGSNEE